MEIMLEKVMDQTGGTTSTYVLCTIVTLRTPIDTRKAAEFLTTATVVALLNRALTVEPYRTPSVSHKATVSKD
jgi:hypothetical protein